jgi:hypothetical protein
VAVQCQELAGVQYTKLLHQYSTLRDEHAKLIGKIFLNKKKAIMGKTFVL